MPRRSPFWLAAALLALGIEIIAACSGGDASWDMRNYHLYAPFALLHKSFGTDVAPGHMQTFLSPTLDLIYYALARSIPSTLLLNLALAVPQAVAAILALALSWRLIQPRDWPEAIALFLLTAMTATGVAALSTIALSMSEILPVALVLAAWLTLIQRDLDALPTPSRLFIAGLLVGAACGLKLTLSFATIALLLILVLIPRRRWSDLATRPIVFGLGIFVGTVALTGYWWIHQWVHYGNPLFPALNNIFRSPSAVPDSFMDRTFLPRSFGEAIAAPWSWTLSLSRATAESRLRDPRFAIGLIAAIAGLIQTGLTRPRWRPWPVMLLPAWFILAFVLWRAEFSIHRYLSVLELTIGTITALAIFPVARRLRRPWLLPVGSAGLLAACLVITVYPQMSRTPPGMHPPFTVDLGPLAPDSTVLLLDNEPMGYLSVFADSRIRFLGTNDFFMSLDGTNPLQPEIQRAIATPVGPLYGLESPDEQPGRADTTLAHYALTRENCHAVITNVSPAPIRLCRLVPKPT